MVIHTVQPGDSVYTIAKNNNVPMEDIVEGNQLSDPSKLIVGQALFIPEENMAKREIYVNGYTYPSIRSAVLKATLPYLTYLSIFTYTINADGTLNPINDTELIRAAREADVAPMMVIANMKTGEGFKSDLASSVLNSEQAQNRLIQNVITTMRSKNYFGLDIDFEYVYPSDREAYNRFLEKVAKAITPLGYTLTTAIAPKLSDSQIGLLYQAHDYAAHGRLVDHVIIMTYEWGYTYGPAMAVSPADQVERVLQYAVKVIPPRKILMGMPNYGYDWTLPFVKGTAARSLSNIGALQLAARVNARIQYDPKQQAPFFRYYDENRKQHEVWFDDARSIAARLALINEYNLGGVSYWTVNNFFNAQFRVLESMFRIKKLL